LYLKSSFTFLFFGLSSPYLKYFTMSKAIQKNKAAGNVLESTFCPPPPPLPEPEIAAAEAAIADAIAATRVRRRASSKRRRYHPFWIGRTFGAARCQPDDQ
jgi:hypothetical protein